MKEAAIAVAVFAVGWMVLSFVAPDVLLAIFVNRS